MSYHPNHRAVDIRRLLLGIGILCGLPTYVPPRVELYAYVAEVQRLVQLC